jgi:uncharacterized circularly permuted ATP-grasp superfamily protein
MNGTDGAIRSAYKAVGRWLEETPAELLAQRHAEAELLFRRTGITFNVYGESDAEERLIPYDIIPRILSGDEWDILQRGLVQRVDVLNRLIVDLYGAREVIKAGILPEDLVFTNEAYRPEMIGIRVPWEKPVPIAGIDIVRVDAETFYVLEDNARTPSGVSYMLNNREVSMMLFPDLFSQNRVQPIEHYPDALLATLESLAPANAPSRATIALLTPGSFNSAYYEHSFLADRMGIDLVEGRDLEVRDDILYMRTTAGPQRVDVLYRRVDDDFLDPLAFNPDSMLGVPGLFSAYKAGNLTLANAIGTGIADDKAIYTYMPEIIRFFTGEEPILKNVPTWRCREPEALSHVLDNLKDLVVKEVHGSGGYGMLVGPASTIHERTVFAAKLKAEPENFIAQPTLALSSCPTFVDQGIAPRHVDLRPFVLSGADDVRIVPGGLTRVALKEGSLVVNSSQGGGTKDTWVIG